MKVILTSCGNPDHFQDPNQPMFGCQPGCIVTVNSLEEASTKCKEFIKENCLGAGNWIGGKVYENDRYIAQISFSGKIFHPDKNTHIESRKEN